MLGMLSVVVCVVVMEVIGMVVSSRVKVRLVFIGEFLVE